MNKSIVLPSLAVLLTAALCSSAQADSAKKSMKVKTDSALSGVYVPGTGGVGGGIVIEPKIEVASNLRVGLRTAIAISGGGSIDSEGSDVSIGVGINVAVMAKAEYTIPTKTVRPVLGLGAGMYSNWVCDSRAAARVRS